MGIISQVDGKHFVFRLRSVAGEFTVEQLTAIAAVAATYGRGTVHLTSRQGIEIPFVPEERVQEAQAAFGAAGLATASCGPRVRTVTACQGKAICRYGVIETQGLAREIDARYGGAETPHKFKIGVTGCRNNCLKADENDVGVKGTARVVWQPKHCNLCARCVAGCPAQAIEKTAGAIRIDADTCIGCGQCAKVCPQGSIVAQPGYRVSIGGLFGREIAVGQELSPFVQTAEEVLAVISQVLAYYRQHGERGQRFGKLLQQRGLEELKEIITRGR